MRAGRIDFRFIGCKIRKERWQHCYLLVLDVGHRYVWGDLFDATTGEHFGIEPYPADDNDWLLYVDAKRFIDLLPVKEPNARKANP